jgi:UDP-glucose 4-epimerase
MRVLVTGGAGFIGSHLVDALLARGDQVVAYDRLSTGSLKFLEGPMGINGREKNSNFSFVKGNVRDTKELVAAMKGSEVVFHLAANADVRGGVANRQIDLQENVIGTSSVLEAARETGVKKLVFTSSAVIYGEPDVIPTPESYRGPQTSLYGASKLAAEAFMEAYTSYYGFESYVYRFVSLMGERYTHGVVFDFVTKLRKNAKQMEILGDGSQKKSYLYVKDAVAGILRSIEMGGSGKGRVEAYNLGHSDVLTARKVADLVCKAMELDGVSYTFTGGKRGWLGDSPIVLLDTSKISKLGWKPTLSVEEAIERTVSYLIGNPDILNHRPQRS